MSIIRVRKDEKYFSASNEPFNDKRLSWESRGLMGYLLSKPNNWNVRMEDLEKQGPAGNHKLRRMLAELRQFGYMNRIRITLENNIFDWITEVYESPSQNLGPSKKIKKVSSGGKSTSGSSTSGKVPDIVITDPINTESLNVNERTALLSKLYQDNITMITPLMADMIKDAAVEFTDGSWYAPAFGIAVENNARNWKYVYTVLKNWKEKGRDWKPESTKKKTTTQSRQAQNTAALQSMQFDEKGELINGNP